MLIHMVCLKLCVFPPKKWVLLPKKVSPHLDPLKMTTMMGDFPKIHADSTHLLLDHKNTFFLKLKNPYLFAVGLGLVPSLLRCFRDVCFCTDGRIFESALSNHFSFRFLNPISSPVIPITVLNTSPLKNRVFWAKNYRVFFFDPLCWTSADGHFGSEAADKNRRLLFIEPKTADFYKKYWTITDHRAPATIYPLFFVCYSFTAANLTSFSEIMKISGKIKKSKKKSHLWAFSFFDVLKIPQMLVFHFCRFLFNAHKGTNATGC